jgi:hypothetical protein
MKTMRYLVIVLAVLATARVSAQETNAARMAGHVLLVKGERGLEGDIEKIGGQYRIRRGTGEVWLPADQAARLCADWDDAYAFMKSRANLGDPEERLRLARWCQLNNLRSQALIEARLALDMRPAHAESRQLVALLARSVQVVPGTPAKPPAAKLPKNPVPQPSSDVSADSFALFATRVQPILMNTCVSCHSGGRGGDFQLLRTDGGQRGSTQANLIAVLSQVKADNPLLSPLLIKAVSPHGNAAQAPITDRQSIPFKTLHGWVDYLLANNPHLRYRETEGVASAPKKPAEPVAFAQAQVTPPLRAKPIAISRPLARSEVSTEAPSLPPDGKAAAPRAEAPSASIPMTAANREEQAQGATALDPFDPAIFNRQVQPRK